MTEANTRAASFACFVYKSPNRPPLPPNTNTRSIRSLKIAHTSTRATHDLPKMRQPQRHPNLIEINNTLALTDDHMPLIADGPGIELGVCARLTRSRSCVISSPVPSSSSSSSWAYHRISIFHRHIRSLICYLRAYVASSTRASPDHAANATHM